MNTLTKLLTAIVLLALSVSVAVCQTQPTTLGSFTVPATIAASTTTNVAQAITVHQGKDLAVQISMVATNASTSDVVMTFQCSIDGTTYTTANGFTKTNALNGTTAVVGYHVIPAETIGPARTLRLHSVANAHNAPIQLTSIRYAWSN